MRIGQYPAFYGTIASDSPLLMDTGSAYNRLPFSTLKANIDARILTGASATTVEVPANGYLDRTYTFASAFSSPPTVIVQLKGGVDSSLRGMLSAFVTAPTTSDVTVRYYNAANLALTVGISYVAVGA